MIDRNTSFSSQQPRLSPKKCSAIDSAWSLLASSVIMLTTGQRIVPRLTQHQGPAQILNTVGLTTQLSLAKVGQELSQVLTPQENPSDLLGLAFKE